MNFIAPAEFIMPKMPQYQSGYLVIESDDGNYGDYTHWYQKIKILAEKYSQWANSKAVTCCFNINSGTIGKRGKLNLQQLMTIYNSGMEIMAHGRHHVGLGQLTLTRPAVSGDTKIYVGDLTNTGVQRNQEAGYIYTYRLYDENKEEIVTLTGYNTDENSLLVQPLNNSYAAGAKLQISAASMEQLVQGCINDLRAWGIEVKNFTFPYHAGSYYDPYPEAVDYVSQWFDSCRGNYDNTNVLDSINWSNLASMPIRVYTPFTMIDRLLDQTVNNNLLMIAFGHGETSDEIQSRLEYLIDGAMSRGIRILQRRDAYKLLR